MTGRYKLTILMLDGDVDPAIIEFDAWNDDNARVRMDAMLVAYPEWKFWRLQRLAWDDVANGISVEAK